MRDNVNAAAADPNLLHRIIWSDEATFHLNGSVNRHNTVYYSQENPHVTVEKVVASVRVTVWAAFHTNGIIGPFFVDNECC